jgi:DHA1 family tetracycline resistance protein-like MFS transporter
MLDGLLGGDISLAQAYISDITSKKDRSRGLGLIGAAFGVSFILGPALGGTLSAGGNYALPAWVAAVLASLNLVGVLFLLPESLSSEERNTRTRRPASRITARALLQALQRPCVGPLLAFQLLYGVPFTMFQTIFALFAGQRLGLTAQSTSYVLTYVGVLVVLVQGGGVGLLSRRFADKQLILGGTVVLSLSLLAWSLTTSIPALLVSLAPLALSGGTLNVVSSSALTKAVYREEMGGTLGLSAALSSLSRIVAPILGGFLIGRLGPTAPGLLGGLVVGALVPFVWQRIMHAPDLACAAPQADPTATA